MRFYNDTDHRQCTAVDEGGLDCAAPEGHDGPHANVNGQWKSDGARPRLRPGPHTPPARDRRRHVTSFNVQAFLATDPEVTSEGGRDCGCAWQILGHRVARFTQRCVEHGDICRSLEQWEIELVPPGFRADAGRQAPEETP